MVVIHPLDHLLPSQQPVAVVVVVIMDQTILQDNLVDLVVVMVLHLHLPVLEMREETIQDVVLLQKGLMVANQELIIMEPVVEEHRKQDKVLVVARDQVAQELLYQLMSLHPSPELLDLLLVDIFQVAAVVQDHLQALVDLVAVELGELNRQDKMRLQTQVVEVEVPR
jgi:hypothetical protein